MVSERKSLTTKATRSEPAYLDLSILEISKVVLYEFQFGYVKKKYGKKTKLRYMDIDNFIAYMKQKIFALVLQNTLKQDLIQILN